METLNPEQKKNLALFLVFLKGLPWLGEAYRLEQEQSKKIGFLPREDHIVYNSWFIDQNTLLTIQPKELQAYTFAFVLGVESNETSEGLVYTLGLWSKKQFKEDGLCMTFYEGFLHGKQFCNTTKVEEVEKALILALNSEKPETY